MKHYKSIGKYLRAVEKTLLVTSTIDEFPPLTEEEKDTSIGIAMPLRDPTTPRTPLFSPIPFLHDDARRSKSVSPPPFNLSSEGIESPSGKVLGLVDELDDPAPGHLREHPTALSSVTTIDLLGSLEDRFVRAEGADNQERMVLDDASSDKENNG
jgi:serine/threonine-protein phosphatase 4 regulatory subunit 2